MPGVEKSFLIYCKNGEIGFKVDKDLTVKMVQNGSMAEGKICVGHKVLRINQIVMVTKAQFEKTVKDHAGQSVTVFVWHDKEKIKNAQSQDVKKEGFEIKDVCIVWNPISQQKLGLCIKGEGPNVYVTSVPKDSVCAMHLREGDRILSVDGWCVETCDMARKLMVQAFRINNRALLRIERAVSDITISTASASNVMHTACTNQEPSIIMPSDVIEIMQRQIAKLEQNEDKKIKGLCKEQGKNDVVTPPRENKQVQINPHVNQKIIAQDNSAIVPLLQKVPEKSSPYQPQNPSPTQQ